MHRPRSSPPRRRRRAPPGTLAVALIAALAFGCGPSGPPSEGAGDGATAQRGQQLFAKHCASCHGPDGRGNGPAAWLLHPKPRDFADGFRLVSTANREPTAADVFTTITRGMAGSAMPPWEWLPAADRQALADEVLRLRHEALVADLTSGDGGLPPDEAEAIVEEHHTPGPALELPPAPEPSLELLARGERIYLSDCASCHGPGGRGRAEPPLVNNRGFPVRARDFTRGVFKGSADRHEIARRILAGMPGTPMPSYLAIYRDRPDALWALVYHVRSMVPEGVEERHRSPRRELVARRVDGPLSADPASEVWSSAATTWIPLLPLWWRPDRVEGVLVSALHDGERLAVRMSWVDTHADRRSVRTQSYTDGAALQFSTEAEPPFFAMGSEGHAVTIWHWKAQAEADLEDRQGLEDEYPRMVVDRRTEALSPRGAEPVAVRELSSEDLRPEFLAAAAVGNIVASLGVSKSAVETLGAGGFGTLTSRRPELQSVEGSSRHDGTAWEVVFVRDVEVEGDDVRFEPGGPPVAVGFAVWDGDAGDRNGQKSVSPWHRIRLEESAGGS